MSWSTNGSLAPRLCTTKRERDFPFVPSFPSRQKWRGGFFKIKEYYINFLKYHKIQIKVDFYGISAYNSSRYQITKGEPNK